MAQKKTPLSRIKTRILAGKLKYDWLFSPENSIILSNNWLLGFASRCENIEIINGKVMDIPRAHENGEKLISLFFDLYRYYINEFNILPDDIWNLDKAWFKIEESTKRLKLLVPDITSHAVSDDSSEVVTALEMISKAGKIGKPLLIYKGVDQMENWFPGVVTKEYDSATSSTGFINEMIFNKWVSEHFSSSEDKWSLLLVD